MPERALLMAVPLRHLECAAESPAGPVTLPAGGPGDLGAAVPDLAVLVMATDAGDAAAPAATWRATFVRRVPYEPGAPWPARLPRTWVEEHGDPPLAASPLDTTAGASPVEADEDADDDYDDDADEDEALFQSFLEVTGLERLPRDEWLFANELVGKQARRGRSFRPRVPTIVSLPD